MLKHSFFSRCNIHNTQHKIGLFKNNHPKPQLYVDSKLNWIYWRDPGKHLEKNQLMKQVLGKGSWGRGHRQHKVTQPRTMLLWWKFQKTASCLPPTKTNNKRSSLTVSPIRSDSSHLQQWGAGAAPPRPKVIRSKKEVPHQPWLLPNLSFAFLGTLKDIITILTFSESKMFPW